jgi:uncharacterized protein with HEPN domain
MSESDRIRLRHMLEASREAVAFGSGKMPEDLSQDRVLTLALLKSIEIIGEAASKVGPDLRERYPGIPWMDIVGMRHRLVHGYFAVDLSRVCDTVADDLPPLIAQLERILSGEEQPRIPE